MQEQNYSALSRNSLNNIIICFWFLGIVCLLPEVYNIYNKSGNRYKIKIIKEEVFMEYKELMDFLCTETEFDDLGNERILHDFPAFGEAVGKAINSGNLIKFTTELSDNLDKMDLYKASVLSNFIGFGCEKEDDTSAGQGVIELLEKSCINLYNMFKSLETEDGYEELPDFQEIYNKNKDWARAYFGFNTLCVTAMAFLTRDVELRKMLADKDIGEEITYLTEETPESPYLKSIYYVDCMQRTCSGLKLLVLYPEGKRGFIAEAGDINNCFHLIFLLEEEIADNFGRKYGMNVFYADESITDLAHGGYPDDCWGKSYVTHFTECNYSVMPSTVCGQDEIMNLVWGEMPPDCIPVVDGYHVIILLDGGPARSFDVNFLAVPHNALDPYVEIERELDSEEYVQWEEKTSRIAR